MEAVQEEGCATQAAGPPQNLLQPSPFEMQQAAAAGAGTAQTSAAMPPVRQSGSSRLSWTLGRLPATSSTNRLSQQGTQEGSQQRQQASASSGLQLRLGTTGSSQQYRAWQAAGLAAAAAAAEGSAPFHEQQQGGGQVSTAPASLSVMPAQSAAVDGDLLQDAQHELLAQHRREQLHQQAVAVGLAGGGWVVAGRGGSSATAAMSTEQGSARVQKEDA